MRQDATTGATTAADTGMAIMAIHEPHGVNARYFTDSM